MGLFGKDNPAEKELKRLTGGFLLSSSFTKRLKNSGLSTEDGIKIKNQLKDEIKDGKLLKNNVEDRLNQLINKYGNFSSADSQKRCPKCGQNQEPENAFCINCGYEFTHSNKIKCPHCGKKIFEYANICPFCSEKVEHVKTCPVCNKTQDESNEYCINCRHNFKKDSKEDTKLVCPNCNHTQHYYKSKCIDCGYDFESQEMPKLLKKCPECGMLQKASNYYCRKCKHDLRLLDYEPCDDLIECSQCGCMIPEGIDTCPFCSYNFYAARKEELEEKRRQEKLKKLQLTDYKSKIAFLHNYDFNVKTCPECDTRFLKTDPFCFNCGASVVTHDTVKNDNLVVKNGKLVEKTESEPDAELSDLEALYNQTVKSKYDATFKVAYVLFLDAFSKNPNKKFSDKLAKQYETTPNKLKKQALEDEFIEPASPLAEAKKFKVTELKEILKKHDLKVSGKKDELIERLGENLSEDELKKYFKSKNYQISAKGEEFLNLNAPILYILENRDISHVFYPSEIGKIFDERQYSQDEIYDRLLEYLKRTLDEKLTGEIWVDFKSYSNAVAQVEEDKGDLKDALNTRFKVFLFDINNYSPVLNRPDVRNTKLKQKDMLKLTQLMHNLTLPIDELKELFEASYDEVLFKTVISKKDSLIYLLKVFGGEDLNTISSEISESYSNPY